MLVDIIAYDLVIVTDHRHGFFISNAQPTQGNVQELLQELWLLWRLQRWVQQHGAILSMDANDVHDARPSKVPRTGDDNSRCRAPGASS
jgi:hypothetical protein